MVERMQRAACAAADADHHAFAAPTDTDRDAGTFPHAAADANPHP